VSVAFLVANPEGAIQEWGVGAGPAEKEKTTMAKHETRESKGGRAVEAVPAAKPDESEMRRALHGMLSDRAVRRGHQSIAFLRAALDRAERDLEARRSPGGEVRNMGQYIADLAECSGMLDALDETKGTLS